MLKKTIKYEDYNGVEQTDDFYFNLTKAELVQLEASSKAGFADTIQAIVDSGDGQKIIEHFQKIILMAYGVKSADGKRFIKSEQLKEEFTQTEAFSELFMELATNAEAAAAFMQGIIPKGLAAEVQNVELPTDAPVLENAQRAMVEYKDEPKAKKKNPKDMTKAELLAAFEAKA